MSTPTSRSSLCDQATRDIIARRETDKAIKLLDLYKFFRRLFPAPAFGYGCRDVAIDEMYLPSVVSPESSTVEFDTNADGKCYRNKEATGAAFTNHSSVHSSLLGDAMSDRVNLPVSSLSLKSADQVYIKIDGKCSQTKDAASLENHSGRGDFHVCDHPRCSVNETKDRFLEVLLMVSSFLLSFGTVGAFYFTQALTAVGSHDDPVLKQTLANLKWVFAASFFSNFLGVLLILILHSRRECHPYKKVILAISNSASFLFMLLGYGLVIGFNIQRA